MLLLHIYEERRGSVVESLTRARPKGSGSSLTGVTALWSLSKHIYPSSVLVQSRKIRPCLTERLLIGRKNQIKQTNKHIYESTCERTAYLKSLRTPRQRNSIESSRSCYAARSPYTGSVQLRKLLMPCYCQGAISGSRYAVRSQTDSQMCKGSIKMRSVLELFGLKLHSR